MQQHQYLIFTAVITLLMSNVRGVLAEEVFVQVESAKLRSQPKQFSPGVQDIKFGDALSVVNRESGWVYGSITTNALKGYVHESAITPKKIVLSSKQISLADVAVDESQVYLAGKGFNEQVEKQYEGAHPELSYAEVDKMVESSRVKEEALVSFITDGSLEKDIR